ncbi:aspartyl-phosphate phosphatase Spo0E family protein [Lederbergia ruris]|uniref:aspartyl-phosphate phosphatase Spo0E family protein n=1 Tax=Lederbergia ruris TaxID=217495 RepID=UPI00278BDC59|nr:aspartyl-phosphate phosphatase Spo0E family protein [Lederbergia ruris]
MNLLKRSGGNFINKLNEEIEILRRKMYKKYESDPRDPEILLISQTLDKLLNVLQSRRNKNDQSL